MFKRKGAVFYGTFGVNIAKNRKNFGASVKLIPYEECSTADGKAQTQICKDKDIKSYPTWIFADGSILKGVVPLSELAEKTNCELPNESL